MSTRAVGRFLKQHGIEVRGTKDEPNILRVDLGGIDGMDVCEIVASSKPWEAPWQCSGYSLVLGQHVEPLPARYIVVSKGSKSLFIFETTVKRFWSTNRNGTFDAPLCTGDFFRLDGKLPAPYTRDMLMRETFVRPRKITPKESAFLAERKALGAFRVLADKLRSQGA